METNPVKVIRLHCLDCAYSPKEVELCPCTKCNFWPWRFGKNPYWKKKEFTDEEREALAKRLADGRAKKGTVV